MGPPPGNWLAAHRADLTLGKIAICIFVAIVIKALLSNKIPKNGNILLRNGSIFFSEIICCGTHWKCPAEMLPRGTQNIFSWRN